MPGPGRSGIRFRQVDTGRRVTIIPSDADPLVLAGRLDERLFDLTRLASDDLDDNQIKHIPLLVQYTSRQPRRLAGATVSRALPRFGGAAVRLLKQNAGGFLSRLDGVRKVWVNARLRPLLDRSTTQIGVPAVQFRSPVDDRNRAVRDHTLPFTLTNQPGTKLPAPAKVELEISTDTRTWQRATVVHRSDGTYEASVPTLPGPRTSGDGYRSHRRAIPAHRTRRVPPPRSLTSRTAAPGRPVRCSWDRARPGSAVNPRRARPGRAVSPRRARPGARSAHSGSSRPAAITAVGHPRPRSAGLHPGLVED